ncbi:hypothetical protein DICSQDRAFT_176039 [Dichomitus squalens LYAD-421 SS1]|uniref:Uncharacterized protein n=1 Tax=Dichomitus squalens (strain LYAD-421) TaxID=732165 RepID=R7SHK9_DICSQ|nr:uncharacterized protein DICSQDRAFT_176039 [Dichomitus squalens LYAD-421 SS1]EJF55353.1 hypothetical protein DICSQDRAFT_176039 [Dichomitus squalens LYAD-421 SS1]
MRIEYQPQDQTHESYQMMGPVADRDPEGNGHVSQDWCWMGSPHDHRTRQSFFTPSSSLSRLRIHRIFHMDDLYQWFGMDRGESPSINPSVNSESSTGGLPSTPENLFSTPGLHTAGINPIDSTENYVPNGTPEPENSLRATTANPIMVVRPTSKHGRDVDPFEDDMGPRNLLPGQLLRAVAAENCLAASLSVAQTQEVLSFCELPVGHMLVNLKIHLLRNENDLLRRYFRLYHRHPDFVTRLRSLLAAVIFAHNTPAYLSNITNSIAEHIEHHLDIIALTPQSRDDPADWAIVKSAIATETTEMRSALKTKLDISIMNNDDIYALTTKALMYDMRPKEEHWARFAFLRHCAHEHKASGKNGKMFWPYVDGQLVNIRKKLKQVNAPERKEAETKYV